MIINVNNDVETLNNIDLTKDIIISFKTFKNLEQLKLIEIADIDCEIFLRNRFPIKSTNINNALQFDYHPKIKISTPMNVRLQLDSNLFNMSLNCNFDKTPIQIIDADLYFILYENFKLSFKQIDIQNNKLTFAGNTIPTGNTIIEISFINKIIDNKYTLSNNIYLIQNSMIFDNFPNFSDIIEGESNDTRV